MAVKVIMPKQGLQMTEGIIIEWYKKEGDSVKEGDLLFSMETDKLAIDIDSHETGTLLKILKDEGETVPITETIAVIGEPGEDISAMLEASKDPDKKKSDLINEDQNSSVFLETGKTIPDRLPSGRVFASPRARMRAKERSLNLVLITGTGPDGLIIEKDVLLYKAAAVTPAAAKKAKIDRTDLSSIKGSGPRGKIYTRDLTVPGVSGQSDAEIDKNIHIPVSGMRKVIADRMRYSLDTAAQAVHNVDVDMSESVRLRDTLKSNGIKVSYNDIIIKAAAEALKLKPEINSSFSGNEIIRFANVNIGMAVAVENGLLVPVIGNADTKSLLQINKETQLLGEKAKSGQLDPDDMLGATFTISNLGMLGLDSFTAIINSPESGILAVGAVKDKAVVIKGQIAVRPVCSLTLTYDHRIIDGAPAAEFLMMIKAILENPYRLI